MSRLSEQILKLQQELKPDWDSYDAAPIDPNIVPIALEVAGFLEEHNLDSYFGVYPLTDGGLQFETNSDEDFCTIKIIGKELLDVYVSYDEVSLA